MIKKLTQAYDILSKMELSGNNVEYMAAAKALLREVYKEINEKEKEE